MIVDDTPACSHLRLQFIKELRVRHGKKSNITIRTYRSNLVIFVDRYYEYKNYRFVVVHGEAPAYPVLVQDIAISLLISPTVEPHRPHHLTDINEGEP